MKSRFSKWAAVTEIQNLMSSYCRFVDTKDWDGLTSILADSINFKFQDELGNVLNRFKSRDEFLAACIEGIGTAVTVHHLHSPEIALMNKKKAVAVWAMEDRFYSSENALQIFHGYGHYHVRFCRTSGQWQIESLLLTRVYLLSGSGKK